MTEGAKRPIVVGVDQSASSDAALAWAASEAARHGRSLRVLHACAETPLSHLVLQPAGGPAADPPACAAPRSRVLAAASAATRGVPVTASAVEGDPIEVLLDASRDAAMLVVGWRDHMQFGQLWMPSVASAVAGRACCPVAVIRGVPAPTESGPVLVGVEETAAGESALELAFREADLWRSSLLAIRACGPAGHRTEPGRGCAGEAAEWQSLTHFVDRWSSKYPEVRVDLRLVAGAPAEVLTTAARTARMTVLGPRRNASLHGPTLGIVGQHVLHHGSGVLLVAPAGADLPMPY